MTDEKDDEFNGIVEPDIEQPDVEPDIEPDIEQPDVEPDIEHAGATAGPLGGAATPEHKLPTVAGPLLGAANSTYERPTETYATTGDIKTSLDIYTCPTPDNGYNGKYKWTPLDAVAMNFALGLATVEYVPENAREMQIVAEHVSHVHIDFPFDCVGTDGKTHTVTTLSELKTIRLYTVEGTERDGSLPVKLIGTGSLYSLGSLTITAIPAYDKYKFDVFFGTPFVSGPPAVTVADLEARWHTLTDTEKTVASSLIGDAINYIKQLCPNYDDIPTDTVKRIVCAMVKRAMLSRDSSGISQQSETVGSFSASYTWSNPTGDLYLTREERRQLGLGAQHAGGWEL